MIQKAKVERVTVLCQQVKKKKILLQKNIRGQAVKIQLLTAPGKYKTIICRAEALNLKLSICNVQQLGSSLPHFEPSCCQSPVYFSIFKDPLIR